MQKRLKIIMDYEHKIKPDYKTNWILELSETTHCFEWSIEQAMRRGILVIQP